jgi:hypothetical protein
MCFVSFAIWGRSVLLVALVVGRPALLHNEHMFRQKRGAKRSGANAYETCAVFCELRCNGEGVAADIIETSKDFIPEAHRHH